MNANKWEGLVTPFVSREKIKLWNLRTYPLAAHGAEQAGVELSLSEQRFLSQRAERARAALAKASPPAAAASSAAAPSPGTAHAQAAAGATPYAVAEPSPGPPTSETVVRFQGYECDWCARTERWL